MPRPHRARIFRRDRLQLIVVAIHARQARPRRFIERDAKLHLRNGIDDRFVNILDRLNEMALPDNDVAIGWNLDPDRVQVHVHH